LKLIPELETENLIISVLKPDDFELFVKYNSDNRNHLSPWEPTRIPEYFGLEETKKRVEVSFKDFQLGTSISFVAFDKNKSEIICLCTFSNIVYGVFQACNLGYSISEKKQGLGLMYEMLQASIHYVFTEYNLHRIMANYIPSNIRSGKLLDKLGFQKEGIAKSYLKIAGTWQDHVLTSKINPC
jgi:ribosomal-protein-alanine N-acetyltransferase